MKSSVVNVYTSSNINIYICFWVSENTILACQYHFSPHFFIGPQAYIQYTHLLGILKNDAFHVLAFGASVLQEWFTSTLADILLYIWHCLWIYFHSFIATLMISVNTFTYFYFSSTYWILYVLTNCMLQYKVHGWFVLIRLLLSEDCWIKTNNVSERG